MCEYLHHARKEDGKPVLGQKDITQATATLTMAEQECAKLHALAGTSAEMLDESWHAFGLPLPLRSFAVLTADDPLTSVPSTATTNGNGHVPTSLETTKAVHE